MAIIDLDSHLRDGWLLDEIYRLPEPFAKHSPRRIGDGKFFYSKFEHDLSPMEDPLANANFKKPVTHQVFYNPEANQRGNEVMRWQQGGYDMDYRLKDNAREGIDFQLIFPTQIDIPSQNPGPLGAAAARAYNNWAHKLVAGHRDRLSPVAMMPAGCPEEMPNELRHCVADLGCKSAHLVSYTRDKQMDDPAFFPLYQTAQELDIPLFCHPSTLGDAGTLINRQSHFFPIHNHGRPLNCVAPLVAMVLGGVFEKFPRLKVVFFEVTAEFLVFWMHRMDDDYEVIKDAGMCPQLSMTPSEYVRRNCYITCEADEKWLAPALAEVGETHVLMATDYPHFDSTFPNTVSGIRERPDISPKQKKLILEDNALDLIHL
jgi:predicted TIM-barrel fold metal-dependent hydrolase